MRCDVSLGNVKLGLKLEGIKVAEGGCIVEGKANLSGVSLSVLNDKQREKMQKAYDTFRLVTQTAKQYAPEIATALNKAKAVVDAIGDLSQKISEKKRNTKALLEHFAIAQEPTLIQNCKEVADESKALQDSLEKTIELVKSGKIKAKLADLQAACVKNVAFMNKLAPALAQCQGLSEPNLRDPKSCGPCADPWDMMPTNIVFVCNEAMNKVFGVESTSLLLPPDGDDNPQTENTSPQVATKSLFFEVQTGCDTDKKLTHVYTTTNSLGERFEYTACKLGDVTYFHYKGGEYWYYKGQYYKSNDHYNQTKQRIEQGFEMYNWSTRTYDYVNLPIGKLTLEQLADALGEFYYSTFGGMAGAEAGLVFDVLNNVFIQTDLSCKGTKGDSYRSCLVSNAPKEFAKMVALGTLAVGVYKSANFIWNKSVNILKLSSGGALNLVEKFKSLNTSKVRPPAFENKAYAEFLDDFAGNIKDFEGSGAQGSGRYWRTAVEMRDDVMSWAKIYIEKLPSMRQLEKFNKACAASYKKVDGSIETMFGRNGGILNTHTSYPTISAEKGLGLHSELAKRLPENAMWPNTANCAECDAVNQALHNGAKWDEIQIHTIDIRPNGTMTDVIQCSDCQNIFQGMYVTSQ